MPDWPKHTLTSARRGGRVGPRAISLKKGCYNGCGPFQFAGGPRLEPLLEFLPLRLVWQSQSKAWPMRGAPLR